MSQDIFFNSCREMNSFAVTIFITNKEARLRRNKIRNHEIDYVPIARAFLQFSTQIQSTNVLEKINIAIKSKCSSLPK